MEEKFICEFCGKEFNTWRALVGHSGNCKNSPKNKDQTFECQYCHRTDFTSKSGFKFHENHCSQRSDYVKIHIVKPKTACQYCGKLIENANLKKHEEACCNPESKLNRKKMQVKDYNEDLTCRYCGKQYKDAGNLVKHEKQECLLNPDITDEMRIKRTNEYKDRYINLPQEVKDRMAWARGLTKETDIRIAHYAEIMTGRKNPTPNHVYKEHNDDEINKWFNYISSKDLNLPKYKVSNKPGNYKVISKKSIDVDYTLFEHDFIVNELLDGKLPKESTVHHINENKEDNNIYNLLPFATTGEHIRFHNTNNAWLEYDEETHLMHCINKEA